MLKIKNWAERFENNRTREVRVMSWMPFPTNPGGETQVMLLNHKDGIAHLACWLVLCQVAATSPARGCIARENGSPHTPETLELVSRIPAKHFKDTIDRLLTPQFGVLSQEGATPPQEAATCPQEPATSPQEGAPDVAEGCATDREDSTGQDKRGQDTTRQNTLAASPQKGSVSKEERDALWDCLVSEFYGGAITDVHRGPANAAWRDLLKLGATPASVKKRIKNYRLHMPKAVCTPVALVKHWHLCANEPLLPGQKPPMSEEELDRIIIEAWEQDNGPDLVRRAKEQAAREQAEKEKQNGGSL